MSHRDSSSTIALAVTLIATTFPACVANAEPVETFCDQPRTHCRGQGPVVDAVWLREALAAGEHVQVIDLRSSEAFAAGHVRGSSRLDSAALRTTRDGVRGQLAAPGAIEAALRDAGVRADARVVVIGERVSPTPARVVWMLHYLGHTDVHMLQGGWPAWAESGAEIETGPATAPRGDYAIDTIDARLLVDAEWVLEHLDDPGVTLVDARSPDEFADGHIPGAINIDWHENVSGPALLGHTQLEALYRSVPRQNTVIAYCDTGMRSSLTWLVLHALGYSDVRVYDGSWEEWGDRDDLPKAR